MDRTVHIPSIETERLILRPLALGDFDALAAFYASDRARFIGGPATRQQAWGKFLSFLGTWALRGYGMFAIEEKGSRAFVGRIGHQWHQAVPEVEMAWSLIDGFEGRGYATEAGRAARDWAFRTHGIDASISLIAAENAPSLALARRLGCVREAQDFTYPDGHVVQVWRHPAQAEIDRQAAAAATAD